MHGVRWGHASGLAVFHRLMRVSSVQPHERFVVLSSSVSGVPFSVLFSCYLGAIGDAEGTGIWWSPGGGREGCCASCDYTARCDGSCNRRESQTRRGYRRRSNMAGEVPVSCNHAPSCVSCCDTLGTGDPPCGVRGACRPLKSDKWRRSGRAERRRRGRARWRRWRRHTLEFAQADRGRRRFRLFPYLFYAG